MTDILLNILEQGLIFGIMTLGIYITYEMLDFPDLSVDGTFALGAALSAVSLINGFNPFISLLLAMVGGAVAGGITGILNVKLKITNILSGILVMIGLYSINLRIMGKANLPLFNQNTIFKSSINPVIILGALCVITKVALDLFFKTKMGFILKGSGDNSQMVTSLGVDVGKIKILGLMLSNSIVALSGGIMAQYQKFSDVSMGTGTIVIGLASLIIGKSIFKKVKFNVTTVAILGSILYKLSIAVALKLGFPPTDLKLITCVIVVLALTLNKNSISFKFRSLNLFKGGEKVA
ncbi:ABC transporter permease [Clostridium frigidicarnis]|uniref:Putative ABC transport system permease protein n=1 Tax=Clostridium frigidicarnis TaxID=84698 RepID=A0A1I0XPP9_9CLOT|nr:ABC transporter permease [Clostridium frigidicarnis]SFB02942.1 putative ABC transport system permease protein [Clostridium frigidicarnis]